MVISWYVLICCRTNVGLQRQWQELLQLPTPGESAKKERHAIESKKKAFLARLSNLYLNRSPPLLGLIGTTGFNPKTKMKQI